MATESWRGHVSFLRPASRGRRSAPERSAKTVSFSTFSCLSATPKLPRSHAMQCTHGLPLRAGEDERVLRDHAPSDGVHPRRRLPVRRSTRPIPSPPLPASGGGSGGSRWGGSHDHELAAASMSSLADVVLVTLNYRWAPPGRSLTQRYLLLSLSICMLVGAARPFGAAGPCTAFCVVCLARTDVHADDTRACACARPLGAACGRC